MANDLQSFSDIFQRRILRIPDYQRGYAWKHEQLVDFWEDLLNLQKNKYHYTGLLSLKEVNPEGTPLWNEVEWLTEQGYKLYHVVDGQQRLTTFSILIYQIIDIVKNTKDKDIPLEGIHLGYTSLKDIMQTYIVKKYDDANIIKTYLFGYETDNQSFDYLRHVIFDEPYGSTFNETYYTKNLKHARMFFAKNLKEMLDTEGLGGIEQLYKKLTLHLMFNLHEIKDDYDVYVAFETMNNRGKKLTNLELLKNRLIYLTTLFDDNKIDNRIKEQLRKDINVAWKEVYIQLGRNQDAPLSDDDFLRAHWITYFQYSRKRGDDYIRFLLNKFSVKNVFEKFTITEQIEASEPLPGFDTANDDDVAADTPESEPVQSNRLEPSDIKDYVNNLMEMAKYWYYSFYPKDSNDLTDEEKEWIDKLNRVGMGYFRPLVAAALAKVNKTASKERIALLQAIERFIFLSFRVGGFNASYKSSDYYKKTKELQQGEITMAAITEDLTATVAKDMSSLIASYKVRTDRRFDSGEGFYGWRDLQYFLYEYEYKLSNNNKIQKVDWNLFTKVEKDKLTIEHILPQTPSNWYWRNQFRKYNEEEIITLSASLGNLLPLSQSINSSLQNDSFPDKKTSTASGIRGYDHGSHSEIEVSAEQDWTDQCILKRGLTLLRFMEERWSLKLNDEQKNDLLHIAFVNEERADVPELAKSENLSTDNQQSQGLTQATSKQNKVKSDFLGRFVEFCRANDQTKHLASRKLSSDNWYDVPIGRSEYTIFVQIMKQKLLRIGLYVYRSEKYASLATMKSEIESAYGSSLEWGTSREKSQAKRILHMIEPDISNLVLYPQYFNRLVNQIEKLKTALEKVDMDTLNK